MAILALTLLLLGAPAYAVAIRRDIDRLAWVTTYLILVHLAAIIAFDLAVAEPASTINPALSITGLSCVAAGLALPARCAVELAVLVGGGHVGVEIGAPAVADVAVAVPIVLTAMASVLPAAWSDRLC